jgi:Holliday junction resolvasome RuvABC DNA-binding subunit
MPSTRAGGIGYRVFITSSLAADVSLGDNIFIAPSFLAARRTAVLYGFGRIERSCSMFSHRKRHGAKTACAPRPAGGQPISSITAGDETILRSVPGMGRTAKRVILELATDSASSLSGGHWRE